MKISRRILALAMTLALCLCLTGCSDSMKGSWKITGGTALVAVNGGNYAATGGEVIFTFGINDAFSLDMKGGMGETSKTGTWTTKGEEVTLTIDGTSTVCIFSVDEDHLTLIFTLDGQRSTLELTKI